MGYDGGGPTTNDDIRSTDYHHGGGGGYRVTKTTDGHEVTGLHERFVHAYVPYGPGDDALCNIGTYSGVRGGGVRGGDDDDNNDDDNDDNDDDNNNGGGGNNVNIGSGKSSPIIVRCTVLGYEPKATAGAMILQGTYGVRVHATKANGEYDATLPVWKLQRRYLAK